MFYRKTPRLKQQRTFKINFTDFSGGLNTAMDENILSQKYAVSAYNIKSSTGALTTGMGIGKFRLEDFFEFAEISESITKLFYFKKFDRDEQVDDDRLLAVTESGSLYAANLSKKMQFELIDGVQFTSAPNFICYRLNGDDVVIMTSEQDDMVIWDGNNPPYSVPGAPKITSMCVNYERLFVTVGGDKSAVWFSDDLDPTNWSVSLEEAGFIEMADDKGGLLKVVKFIDYVYIFRSYGIARLTAYADQTQFSLSQLYTTSGRIYPDTVAICGDRIIFLAEDGLYMFDGLQTYKILKNIESFLRSADIALSKGVFLDGCYYLTLNKTGEENGFLLKYDISKEGTDIMHGRKITDLMPVTAESYSSMALAVEGGGNIYTLNESGCFLNEPLKKLWITPVTDLNYPEHIKYVKKLIINTKHDVTVTLMSEKAKKVYRIKGKPGLTEIKADLRGRLFSMKIESDAKDIYVVKPAVLIDI